MVNKVFSFILNKVVQLRINSVILVVNKDIKIPYKDLINAQSSCDLCPQSNSTSRKCQPPEDYKIHTVPHKTSVKLINTLNILDNPLRIV